MWVELGCGGLKARVLNTSNKENRKKQKNVCID